MAGRISEADIAAVKARSNIVDVISDHVTLKRAGVDSFKGLCPFHDERTPSFTVSVGMERYHCFGCQESGDVIAFLMNLQHLSFVEAVEFLADRAGYQLTYEQSTAEAQGPSKTRLYAAHQAAKEFYQAQLFSPAGTVAREFLHGRGFDETALRFFEVGYAPDSWDALTKHLTQQGFTAAELLAGGLVSQGNRGVYDRFRGRPVWPIKETTGQTVGFGARKIFETDQGPKYLNSPESPIYHKSRVLYGIDLAKKAMARDKKAVIVEGYTDVMACHLAGVPYAIATCGTAFGPDHIAVLRRVLGDDASAEVIFTFDPDSAGQAAALKAYGQESKFNAQTYVANNPSGLDPSDLRQHQGDAAVAAMFEDKTPLFEFALQHAINGYDLNSVAGRHQAINNALPIILRIRDRSLQPAYLRELARMVGVDMAVVKQQLQQQLRAGGAGGAAAAVRGGASQSAAHYTLASLPRDEDTRRERDALMAMLQRPQDIGAELLREATGAWVGNPALQQVQQAIARALGQLQQQAVTGAAQQPWVEQVAGVAAPEVQVLVRELALQPLPEKSSERLGHYAKQIVISVLVHDLNKVRQELLLRLQRLPDSEMEQSRIIQQHLVQVDSAKRQLQAEIG